MGIFVYLMEAELSQLQQEPGWTWYIGHPIKFIMKKTILDHF